jgi:DNA polymerase-3 subunit gamma/tau
MDVMEIDGASNRGIDQIRELKSHVGLASFMGGMKVYILDEVHMLTAEAFNALLKTLEEPPPAVMFIFATTEPHKVPATIRSRCQHILFHRISTESMVDRLRSIASAENVKCEDSALWEISRSADGALRDAISLFEQAMAVGRGELTMNSVRTLFGGGSRAEMERWVTQIRERPDDAAAALKQTLDLGVSPERFLDGLFPLLRDMWTYGLWGEKSFAGTSLSDDEKDFLRKESPNWNAAPLKRAVASVAALFPRARFGLRSDVFSGLLMFELLSAFDDPKQETEADARQIPASEPSRSWRPPRPAREASPAAVEDLAPVCVTDMVPPPAARDVESIRPAPSGKSWEILSRLMKEDLPVAAALLDVRIFRVNDALEFDFTEAARPAVNLLTAGRAAGTVERVFGAAPSEQSGEETKDEGGYEPQGVRAPSASAPSPISGIAARLGADILMSKRLDLNETDMGDEEDEQL